jgi:hypothetical protein
MPAKSNNNENDRAPRVAFERPLPAKVMSIDGTRCDDAFLVEICDAEAEIEATRGAADLAEFFLLLTNFGTPVFRRCRRNWVHGSRIGVSFSNSKIGIRSLEEEIQRSAENEYAR